MRLIQLMSCLALITASAAHARPVSYPGGITLMTMNDGDANSIHAHYSSSARYSVGYKAEYWKEDEWQFHGVQLNYLARRWNRPASQANIYVKSGLGLAWSDQHVSEEDYQPASFVGLSADWENRRLFVFYENRYTAADNINNFFTQKARLGVAPYIGDYGDLHTWLMLQVDNTPEKDDTVTLTPMIRMFKGEYLAELGLSDDRDILFNFIARF